MDEMVWCDDCSEPHEIEVLNGMRFVICPSAPPDTLTDFDPRYVKRWDIDEHGRPR